MNRFHTNPFWMAPVSNYMRTLFSQHTWIHNPFKKSNKLFCGEGGRLLIRERIHCNPWHTQTFRDFNLTFKQGFQEPLSILFHSVVLIWDDSINWKPILSFKNFNVLQSICNKIYIFLAQANEIKTITNRTKLTLI